MNIGSICTKQETGLQAAFTLEGHPSGQTSWSEFDLTYSESILTQVTEAIHKEHSFGIKSKTVSSFLL